MYEPLYILTTVIPKDGEFEAYFKDIKSGQLKVVRKELKYKNRYKNIPRLLQFFIENNTFPLSVYDSTLHPIGIMSFNSFQKALDQRCTTLDIEVLNPNRIPNPNHDEIVCISYGNSDWINVRFNGEGESRVGENYTVYFGDEEKIVRESLKDFSDSQDLFLCGYNSSSFDLRYIKRRAELLGIPNEIKTHTAKTLFENRKICIIPNFINIDLLALVQYASLPSTKLEYVSKIFGLRPSKMAIEELWLFYREKNFDKIIEHNLNDVLMTHEVLKKVSFPIYLLAEKTIGSFDFGFYSNLPKNILVRTLVNSCRRDMIRAEKILETINEEIEKISFNPNQEKIREKLNVNFTGMLKMAKLLDLPMKIAEKLKDYSPVFEDLLETYKKIEANSMEEKLSKRMISGIVYKILLNMRKKREYKKRIEDVIRKIKDDVKSRIYCSSGRYLITESGLQENYSFYLSNVILHSEKPKFFLANSEGILIGRVPKKPIGMPEKFYEALINDLFNLALNRPVGEMESMKEKLEKKKLEVEDLKIEVRGVDTSQLSTDSQKKVFADRVMGRKMEERERIYVVKLKEGFSSLEELRKEEIKNVDLGYYVKKFQEVWRIYEEIKSIFQNSLEDFFFR